MCLPVRFPLFRTDRRCRLFPAVGIPPTGIFTQAVRFKNYRVAPRSCEWRRFRRDRFLRIDSQDCLAASRRRHLHSIKVSRQPLSEGGSRPSRPAARWCPRSLTGRIFPGSGSGMAPLDVQRLGGESRVVMVRSTPLGQGPSARRLTEMGRSAGFPERSPAGARSRGSTRCTVQRAARRAGRDRR